MDRAVDKRPSRFSRKRAIVLGIVVAGAAVAMGAFAFERGPYICTTGCLVSTPVPDARTLQFLKDSRAPIDYVPLFAWATGTTYMICNGTHCTVYHENFESNWVGGERIQREGSGGGIGGIGGGGGGGGGGSGGGTVIVGGVQPIPDENDR